MQLGKYHCLEVEPGVITDLAGTPFPGLRGWVILRPSTGDSNWFLDVSSVFFWVPYVIWSSRALSSYLQGFDWIFVAQKINVLDCSDA